MAILTLVDKTGRSYRASRSLFWLRHDPGEVRTKLELLEANVRDRIDAPLISPYFAPLKRETLNASGIFRFFSLFLQASQGCGPIRASKIGR